MYSTSCEPDTAEEEYVAWAASGLHCLSAAADSSCKDISIYMTSYVTTLVHLHQGALSVIVTSYVTALVHLHQGAFSVIYKSALTGKKRLWSTLLSQHIGTFSTTWLNQQTRKAK